MKSLNGLIKDYRKKMIRAEKHRDKMTALEQKMEALNQEHFKQKTELSQIKDLIDWCILSGEQPAEAALKHTSDQIRDKLRRGDKFYMGTYYGTMSGTIGPSGAVLTVNSSPITISCGGAGGGASTFTSSVTLGDDTNV